MNVVRAFLKWTLGAWLTTVVAFTILSLVPPYGREGVLGELISTVLVVGIFSLMYIVPAALGAVLLEWFLAHRLSRLALGAIAGFLAMSWTLHPVVIVMATVAGATAGWLGDRDVPVLSGRWFMATGLGGLLMCVTAFLLSPRGIL